MATITPGSDSYGKHFILQPPQKSATSNIGVIWGPGGGQLAKEVLTEQWSTGLSMQAQLMIKLSQLFTVHLGDLGGFTAGNSTGHAAMLKAYNDLQAAGCQEKIAIVGLSHGHIVGTAWAAANPDKVACLAGVIPAAGLQALRVYHNSISDFLGILADIDEAWGVTYPTALPGSGLPAEDPDHAEIQDKAAVLAANNIPWRAWSGDEDAFVPIQSVRDFAAAYGDLTKLTEISGGNHDNSTLGAVDVDELAQFIYASFQ